MADVYMKSKFYFKRGKAASWAAQNLILGPGEPGFELDTGKLKVGNGITPWNELPYITDNIILPAEVVKYLGSVNKLPEDAFDGEICEIDDMFYIHSKGQWKQIGGTAAKPGVVEVIKIRDDGSPNPTVESNGIKYNSIEDALANVSDGDLIVIPANFNSVISIPANKDAGIELKNVNVKNDEETPLTVGYQSTLTVSGAGVNNAATVSTVNAAKTALIGDISAEAATTDGNTIADVRRYVDAKTKGIASDAKLTELTEKVTANANSIKGINTSLADGGAISNAIAEAKQAGIDATAAVNTLAGKVGTVAEGKTVVKMIEEAQAAATYDDAVVKADIKKNVDAIAAINDAKTGILKQAQTYADGKDAAIAEAKKVGTDAAAAVKTLEDGQVKKNADAISVLNGTSAVDGSVDKKVADAINEFSTKISDDSTVNTFKELIDYAAAHQGEYSTLSGDVQKNTTAIATLNGDGAGSVDKKVADAIAAINKYVEKNGTDRLITEAEGTKLSGIAEGAQVNVIESIKINNVAQTATGKAVNIAVPIADDTSIAITENKIGIKAVDVQKLFIAEGDVLIIDGGKA